MSEESSWRQKLPNKNPLFIDSSCNIPSISSKQFDLDEPSSMTNPFPGQCSSLTSSIVVGCKVFSHLLFTNFFIFLASLRGILKKTKTLTCNTRHWQQHDRTTQSAANAPQSSSITLICTKLRGYKDNIEMYHMGFETYLPAYLGILDVKRTVAV